MRYELKKIATLLIQHRIPYRRLHLVVLIVFCVFGAVNAEDWPTYMHDNSRSGVTAESLRLEELDEAWTYVPPAPPQVAWDGGAPWDSYRSSSTSIFD